ncbi:lipopolysaccharide biosynthesis protein [Parapedobacter indicus]|uniref:Membrane protein involved in the export of O-antigen and teichoic acid n=1 Tax=Parapedobacter indicus TaxID=1477437 RepID=A0A1I3TG34_9SPHI|nr:oligosaccharide flippase family protein [Parapedobacter indicus]PPK99542.1 O-antigen/teichoic acid export membrane protein [Parapedobacter indicus]SFJ68621.1 Membrane protein involved in the export of O-antigen and teichoic acid [Parapedobacter indicus]
MPISRIKSLAKDSIIYGLSSVIARLITVFLVPIYTRIFSPEDYGTLNIINTTFMLIGVLAVFALDSATARWFYDTSDESEKKATFSSWFWFQFTVSVLFALLLIAMTPFFAKYLLKLPLETSWNLWILPSVTLVANILPTMIVSWHRLHRKPIATVIFSLSQSLFTILLTLVFVLVLKWRLVGVYGALLVSATIFSFIALYQMKSWINPTLFRMKKLKEMLNFSLPLIPSAIAFWLLNASNSYFLLYFKDKSEVGLFSIGVALASGVKIFTGAFQQAWGPFAFSIINEPDAKSTYANVFYVFGMLGGMLILSVFLFSPELLKVLTSPRYYSAAWTASILSVNVILIAFTYIASIGTNIMKDNKPYAVGVTFAAVLTIIYNILLTPRFGKEGSALATLLGQLILPMYVFYKAQKMFYIPYNFKKVISIILTAAFLGTLVRLVPFSNYPIEFCVKVLTLISFIITLFGLSRQKLISFLKQRYSKRMKT